MIDLSWASSRLEGNTYTLLDTQRLIQQGQMAEGRDTLEAQMILNHKRAIELLRDLFVWAYERSTQHYIKVKKNLAEPDPLRLRYRAQMHDIIGTVVRELKVRARQVVLAYARDNVPPGDQELFVEMVMDDLQRLHEGVIARYRIRPSQFDAWKRALRGSTPS